VQPYSWVFATIVVVLLLMILFVANGNLSF
jgi:hypothetical protein